MLRLIYLAHPVPSPYPDNRLRRVQAVVEAKLWEAIPKELSSFAWAFAKVAHESEAGTSSGSGGSDTKGPWRWVEALEDRETKGHGDGWKPESRWSWLSSFSRVMLSCLLGLSLEDKIWRLLSFSQVQTANWHPELLAEGHLCFFFRAPYKAVFSTIRDIAMPLGGTVNLGGAVECPSFSDYCLKSDKHRTSIARLRTHNFSFRHG